MRSPHPIPRESEATTAASDISSGRLAVVTVTYNSAKYLADFDMSCRDQSLAEWRLYAIDNDSADDSAPVLRSYAEKDPRYVLIANEENLGVAAGNNQGIFRALSDGFEWILLLNNDTRFESSVFSQLLASAIRNQWQVVVPRILYDEPANTVWYSGGGFDRWKGFTGYHSNIGTPRTESSSETATVEYAPTCAMLIHASVFKKIGFMDESYFVYFDDTDFCWRLKQRGVPIGYDPSIEIIHKVGGSTGGLLTPFTAHITSRNRLFYLRKHFGLPVAIAWLPVFLGFYVTRYAVLNWKPQCLKAALRGTMEFFSLESHVPTFPDFSQPHTTESLDPAK
jgi:GT2 family glycosyltransferase